MARSSVLGFGFFAAFALSACAWDTEEDTLAACSGAICDDPLGDRSAIPARRGTVISDGCFPDARALATLSSPATRRVIDEVVLLCLIPRADGQIAPTDSAAREEIRRTVASVQNAGVRAGGDAYTVSLGVSFTDETGVRFDGAQTAKQLDNDAIRGAWVENLAALVGNNGVGADALDLDLELVPPGARSGITRLTEALAGRLHGATPRRALNLFVPPSLRAPSDLPSGDAFDVPTLGKAADRLRVMTLDYSDRSSGPGPTLVPGWAIDATRFARSQTAASLDLAVPLYGADFGPTSVRGVSYLEAIGLANAGTATRPSRGITETLRFVYTAQDGAHEVWFDDARSLGRTLAAWPTAVLPGDVGIVFFGLGGEDPRLFTALAARTK